jgi:hypothetical protein
LSPKKMPNEGFPEVSFVDDIAYVMHSKCPAALVGSLQHVASCLHDAAASRGLTVNYGSGKAEAMVRLAGPGSAAIKFGMPRREASCRCRIRHAIPTAGAFVQAFRNLHAGSWSDQ